jgi:NADH dehydrogenase
MTTKAPLVVIVGGGFGGLAAAKGLKRSTVDVLLIDRSNHHVFQPLLYQVATSVLAPGQIASPIRGPPGEAGKHVCDVGQRDRRRRSLKAGHR